jgi:plastocyanin
MGKRLIILSVLMVLLFGTVALHSLDREGSQAKAADVLASAPWPMEAHDAQHSGRSPYSGPEVPYLKWTYKTEGGIYHSPLIGADGTIYFGTDDSLYAIDADDALKWRYELEKEEFFCPDSLALGIDGTIYFGFYETVTTVEPGGIIGTHPADGKLCALSPEGGFKWSYDCGIMEAPTIIGGDGTVYIYGTYFKDGMGGQECFPLILALDLGGSVRWNCPLDSFLVATKPTVDREGTIYFCSGGKLCAINPDGTMAWTYQTGEELLRVPVIDSDGTIYFGSTEGTLYVIADLPQSPPPQAEFSMDTAEARAGEKVQFTNSSTGLITSLWWDFGDGMELEQRDSMEGAVGEVCHTYLDEGSYTVSLTVSNPWGSSTMSKNINVLEYAVSQGKGIPSWIWIVIGIVVAFVAGIMIRRYLIAR